MRLSVDQYVDMDITLSECDWRAGVKMASGPNSYQWETTVYSLLLVASFGLTDNTSCYMYMWRMRLAES